MNQQQTIQHFLTALYGQAAGNLNLWTKADKLSHWHTLPCDWQSVVEQAASLGEAADTYFQTGLMSEAKASRQRGTEAEVATIVTLSADVDIHNPAAHKAANLPCTVEEAREVINAYPLAPSLVVHSGNGLQPYWLLEVPFTIQSETDRARIKGANVGLQRVLQTYAKGRGWTVDGTGDLVRLMRLPGTFNHKLGHKAQRVTLLEHPLHRYSLEQLEQVITSSSPSDAPEPGEIDFTEEPLVPRQPSPPPSLTVSGTSPEQADGWQLDSHQSVLLRMFGAANGAKSQALYDGHIDGYPSTSEAVLALLAHLAFYTKDRQQLYSLASSSPLCSTYNKWSRPGWAQDAISKALSHVTKSAQNPLDVLPSEPLEEVDVADDANHYSVQTVTIGHDQLPQYVRDVANYLATARECKVGLGEVVAALFACQAVTGKRLRITNRGRNYYANLWAVVLADSGTDKSGLAELVQGLLEPQGDALQLAPALDVSANSTMEGFLRYHGGLVPPDRGADRASLKAKERDLVAQHRADLEGSALLVDEVRAWIGQMIPEVARQVNGPLLCRLVDNGDIVTRTKGEGVAVLGDACISLLGMGTPDRYNAEVRNPHNVEAGVAFRIVPINCTQTQLTGYTGEPGSRERALAALAAVRSFAATAGTVGQRIGVTYGTSPDPLGEAVDEFAATPLAAHFQQVRAEEWKRLRSKLLIQSAKLAATMALAQRAEECEAFDYVFGQPEVEEVDASPYLPLCVRLVGAAHIANSFHEVMVTEQAERMERVLNVVRRAGKDCAPMHRIRERSNMDGRTADDVVALLVAKGEVAKVQTPAGKSCLYCARSAAKAKRRA